MNGVVLSPTDFVALLNQTLEFAYPNVTVEGELGNFRISKNRWIYFSLRDEVSVVSFFGTVYNLPGPLEDGLSVRVTGMPRMHPKFGFSVSVQTITPVGKGSIKKAADLVRAKLGAEGLFEPSRKRPLPRYPQTIGLITAAGSAAYADFIKILANRWGGVEVLLTDVYVQGEQAAGQLKAAIEHLNQLADVPDVLVITRGGGSAEDLAAFNDERVVRAVASSRVPTIVAIGHEVDESLAELAADRRASTPSSAAQTVVPDRTHELSSLNINREGLIDEVVGLYVAAGAELERRGQDLRGDINDILAVESQRQASNRRLLALFNPEAALRRGYAIVRRAGQLVTKASLIKRGDRLVVHLSDGRINADVSEVTKS